MKQTKWTCQKKQRRGSQSGFTMLELMVSMMVLAVMAVSMIQMMSTSFEQTAQSQDKLIANSLADQVLELLQIDALRWGSGKQISATWFMSGTGKKGMSNTAGNPSTTVWIPFSKAPVNYQMKIQTDKGGATGAVPGRGARFCIFYSFRRGGVDSTNPVTDLVEANVIVIWPRGLQGITTEKINGVNPRAFFSDCGMSSTANIRSLLSTTTKSHLMAFQRYFSQVRRVTYIRQGATQ